MFVIYRLIASILAPVLLGGLIYQSVRADGFLWFDGLSDQLEEERVLVMILKDEINNPQNGWRVRLLTSQNNVTSLQEALSTQNTKVLLLEAEGKARTEAAARQLALARAERDRINQRITAILNMTQPDDPGDIIRQAEALILGGV